MPRLPRQNLAGFPHHVVQRGNNRQACFLSDRDRKRFCRILQHSALRRDCDIHAYVLMTNHVHLLVTPADPTGVSKLMQDVGREYVRYFNNRYHRSGTLWEGRFKSSLVDNERYCLLCYRYIEMNPVRACIVGSPVDYRWSSFAANACNAFDPLVTPHDVWLSLGNDRAACCAAYREFFKDSLGHSQLELIRSSIRKGIPLGSKQFKRRIESRLGIVLGERKVGRPPKID